MHVLQKVTWVLTLVSAGLAALIFPITLFGIQGMGRIGLEEIAAFLSLYLTQPVSIALIFLVHFKKIAPGCQRRTATGFVAFNALCLLAMAALIGGEVFKGDAWLPLILGTPSFLFLLNSCMRALAGTEPTGQA